MSSQTMRGFLEMIDRDFPDEILRITEPVRREFDITSAVFELERKGRSPVVICSSVIRAGLRRFFAAKFPELAFLSYEELPPKVEIKIGRASCRERV